VGKLHQRHGPGEEEGHLQVEDDEEDGDQIEAHVELHPRVVEGVEAALVGRQLLGIRRTGRDEGGGQDEGQSQSAGDDEQDHDRQVLKQEGVH